MKAKAILLLVGLSLVSAASARAQGNQYGRGHGRGNPHTDKQHTDKQGPNDNGDGDDRDQSDFAQAAALQGRINDVITSLSLGTLTTPDGGTIPMTAQGKLYVVMTSRMESAESPPASSNVVSNGGGAEVPGAETAASASRFVDSFAGATPSGQQELRTLTNDLAELRLAPRRLPAVVADFNAFVRAAPASFLANPPAEFVAVRAALQRISAALAKQ